MVLRKHSSRLLSFGVLLVMLLQLFLVPITIAKQADDDRERQLKEAVQTAGSQEYDQNSQAYLERALNKLAPLATDDPSGKGIPAKSIAALRRDLKTAFFDVSRVHSASSLECTLGLIRATAEAWLSGTVTNPAALAGLKDLLLEMRQAADVALTDARVIFAAYQNNTPGQLLDAEAGNPALKYFRHAEQAMAAALEQAAQGNGVAAGQQFLLAWSKATQAMAMVKLFFRPGHVSDIDHDGFFDQLEVRLGANPFSDDTDCDGLSDLFELKRGGTELLPGNPDSDGDKIRDADEDLDGDGLTNRKEQAYGTDPLRADTDRDGLKDNEELQKKTNPLKADTDHDGLSDSAELRTGTNPCDPDTDNDRIPDGKDVLTGTVEKDGVRVLVTGTGDVGASLTIRSLTDSPLYNGMPGLVSPVTLVTATLKFSKARVELPVDLDKVPGGDTSRLRLMYLDTAGQAWRPVEGTQGFDPATKRAWVETTRFATFAVLIPALNAAISGRPSSKPSAKASLDDPGDADSDGDGLTDAQETSGMRSVSGKLYVSNPNDVDSDSDGLLDNEEIGTAVDQGGQRVFQVQADPMIADSDGDGLEDGAEIDNGTPPWLADWDGDGLNDYRELENVTEPDIADTDEDSFSDSYEVEHLNEGFNPLVPDERISPADWARDFKDGALAGDACGSWFMPDCKDTVAFFLGQLTGGATSAIPVVGWITGTIADLRDAIGSAVKGDWVGAGLSLVGFVPYAGDVVKIVGKVVDFVKKYGKLEILLRAVLRLLFEVSSAAGPDARTEGQFQHGHTASDAGPPVLIAGIGEKARELVLKVLDQVDPDGYRKVKEFGGDDFIASLGASGLKFNQLAELFTKLENKGLFTTYPAMKGFMEEMISKTDKDVLFGKGNKLQLNSRVTLNVQKAATRIGKAGDKYVETMYNHLKGALAEHASLTRVPGDKELFPVGHVTGNGPDRVVQASAAKQIDVLEVKAFDQVGYNHIKKWLHKRKVNGEEIYEFDGTRLERHLRAKGHDLASLLEGNEIRYNLFVYDAKGTLTQDLAALFTAAGTKSVPIKGFDGKQIKLIFTHQVP